MWQTFLKHTLPMFITGWLIFSNVLMRIKQKSYTLYSSAGCQCKMKTELFNELPLNF